MTMSNAKLDERFSLDIVEWEGAIRCVYLNGHRIAGGKPWGGGKTIRSWPDISIRELARAVPNLRDHLGLDYLGQPVVKESLGTGKQSSQVRRRRLGTVEARR
jgi:hypothetical protein